MSSLEHRNNQPRKDHTISPYFSLIGFPVERLQQIAAEQERSPVETVQEVREWLTDVVKGGHSLRALRPLHTSEVDFVPLNIPDQPEVRAWLSPNNHQLENTIDDQYFVPQGVRKVLKTLHPTHREVLEPLFGIGDDQTPQTPEEIGKKLGVTASRVGGKKTRAFWTLTNNQKTDTALRALLDNLPD